MLLKIKIKNYLFILFNIILIKLNIKKTSGQNKNIAFRKEKTPKLNKQRAICNLLRAVLIAFLCTKKTERLEGCKEVNELCCQKDWWTCLDWCEGNTSFLIGETKNTRWGPDNIKTLA